MDAAEIPSAAARPLKDGFEDASVVGRRHASTRNEKAARGVIIEARLSYGQAAVSASMPGFAMPHDSRVSLAPRHNDIASVSSRFTLSALDGCLTTPDSFLGRFRESRAGLIFLYSMHVRHYRRMTKRRRLIYRWKRQRVKIVTALL